MDNGNGIGRITLMDREGNQIGHEQFNITQNALGSGSTYSSRTIFTLINATDLTLLISVKVNMGERSNFKIVAKTEKITRLNFLTPSSYSKYKFTNLR